MSTTSTSGSTSSRDVRTSILSVFSSNLAASSKGENWQLVAFPHGTVSSLTSAPAICSQKLSTGAVATGDKTCSPCGNAGVSLKAVWCALILKVHFDGRLELKHNSVSFKCAMTLHPTSVLSNRTTKLFNFDKSDASELSPSVLSTLFTNSSEFPRTQCDSNCLGSARGGPRLEPCFPVRLRGELTGLPANLGKDRNL